MSVFSEHSLSPLDQKARAAFGDHVVVKSLAQHTSFHRLPRYVAEYLISKYVKPDSWKDDLAKVQAKVAELLPDLDHREWIKDKLLRAGEAVIIDEVDARVDLRNGQRFARVRAIQDDRVRIPAAIVDQNPGLLLGGLWGTLKLRYTPETDSENPNELTAFTPFQVGPPDMAAYKSARSGFTSDEWIALMLQSAGYSPEAFPDRRTRLLLLSRLVPLVERNVNFIELGPRQTGKTFLLRNVSPRVFTISGGKTTPANLFVNLSTKAVGILGTRKVVVFDEIAHTSFGDEDETISTLKDYMESGHFSRGARSFAADASLVFTGNLDVVDGSPDPRYGHLFEPLPSELIDSAFLDRVHGYLPGWEVPKITPAALSQGVGFVTDYFGEILARLREDSFQDRVRELNFAPGMTRRDHVAVERIASGLIKLLYPHGAMSGEEMHEAVSLACEMRQRVHNQLAQIAPGEFKPRLIGFGGMPEYSASDLRSPSTDILPSEDRLNTEAIVGAVTGLAVATQDGAARDGDLILIQVSAFAGTPTVQVTGLHGSVLSDSVKTAYNIVRTRFREFGIAEKRLREQTVAVHLVRIAEPKEGPSAGLAFVVGIISALTGRAVKAGCALTGEVTLHGEVTGVGGIPLKVRAAIKSGRKLIILPAENAKEIGQIPDDLLSQVTIVPVRSIEEAIGKVLEPGSAASPAIGE